MASLRTLVLLHAFPLGAGMWAPQRDAFDGWRVVALSLPGFDGQHTSAPSIDAFAAAVDAELDALSVERAVIGGLSLGCYVTFALMRRKPERATGLILADTRSTADSPAQRAGRARTLEALRQTGPRGVFEAMHPGVFGATTLAERPEVVERVRELIESQTPEAIEGAIRAMLDRADDTSMLSSIAVPALVLVGEEDAWTPLSDAQRIAAKIPGATLVRLPRAGHLSNLENPGAFNASVRDFLASLPA